MEHQQPKSVKQQVESLCKRGMALDENRATETLSQVSYFRLKPYWWDMRDWDTDAWVIFEVATFGTLSKIYKNLKHQLPAKSAVAKDFGMYFSNDFSNWLEGISVFRNMIAHHTRLWNFLLTKTPTVPKSYPNPWLKASYSQNQKKTPYFTICNMVYLCNAVRPDNHVKSNIMSLIARSSSLNLRRWGFIDGWEEEPLWK